MQAFRSDPGAALTNHLAETGCTDTCAAAVHPSYYLRRLVWRPVLPGTGNTLPGLCSRTTCHLARITYSICRLYDLAARMDAGKQTRGAAYVLEKAISRGSCCPGITHRSPTTRNYDQARVKVLLATI